MKHIYFYTNLLVLILLIGVLTAKAQGTIIDSGSPTNKWILHNPEDNRKTLFLAPWNNNTWDWGAQTKFLSNGDAVFQGKVGIGSEYLPLTSKLQVHGDFRTTTGRFSSIYSNNTDGLYPATYTNTLGDAQLTIGANWTGGMTDLSLINSNIANTSGGGFTFWQMMSANSKKLLAYMKGDGSFGLGGIVPTRALEVRGVNPIFRIGNGTAQNTQVNTVIGGIEFPTSGENYWMAKINANVGTFSDQPYLTFYTGSTSAERVRIAQDGNVGIGTTTPTSRLDVRGGETSVDYLNVYPQDGTNEGGEVSLKGAGTNPNWQLDVYQNRFRVNSSGKELVSVGPDGTVAASGNLMGSNLISTGANSWIFHTPDDGRTALFMAPAAPAPAYWDWAKGTIFSNNGDVRFAGKLGIGTDVQSNFQLAVEGKIGAREVEVRATGWADFVFAKDYTLPSLLEVETHIHEKQHLPGIPSEAEVKDKGYELGAMDAKLLQKIEELTLYVIQLQKQVDQLKGELGTKKTKQNLFKTTTK